jgi:hypothetical protein
MNRKGYVLNWTQQHKSNAVIALLLLSAALPVSDTFGHKGHTKPDEVQKVVSKEVTNLSHEINSSYLRDIKPILQKACFDCHSSETRYPWYARLPFAGSLIEADVTEAKKHLDLSQDFPFKGHGSVEEDLKAIGDAVEKKSMPPFRYRILHPDSNLSEADQEKVVSWVDDSLKLMKK